MLILLFFLKRPALAQVLLQDDFESGLSGWVITDGSVTTELDEFDPERKYLLKVFYSGQNEYIQIKKTLDPPISEQTNLVFEIEFYDDPQRDYGLGFYVLDTNGNYVMIGVHDGLYKGRYFLRNGLTSFDTKVPRTLGWHTFKIFVTEVGTYAAIDGQSLAYLRAKIPYPNESEVTSFPINNQLKTVTEVAIEYPSWGKPVSLSYWDNFKAYRFRAQTRSTLEKEEDLIIEYLKRYEMDIWSDEFIAAPKTLRGIQNFQLSRLALAAAYGVRAIRDNNPSDWQYLETILSQVVDDYPDGWSQQSYESPISAQAIGVIASWRWNELSDPLKNKIVDLLTKEAEQTLKIDSSRPNQPGDSKAEENAWFASLLGFVSDALPDNPQSNAWQLKAAELGCNSTSSETTNDDYDCEVSQVLTPDFLLVNHGMVSPSYALTVPWGFAGANLIKLNQGRPIGFEYIKNLRELYEGNLQPLVRMDNYTFRAARPEDVILAYTGRDDWGQDATLQDSGWAYLDRVLGLTALDPVVNYAWLTRADGTAYPAKITDLESWLQTTQIICGSVSCTVSADNAGLHFFLNSMDAIDRFMALFIIGPQRYQLRPLTSPPPTPIPGDANGDGKVDGLDYIIWLNNYKQTTPNGSSDGDFNEDGKVDGLDYVIWLNNY